MRKHAVLYCKHPDNCLTQVLLLVKTWSGIIFQFCQIAGAALTIVNASLATSPFALTILSPYTLGFTHTFSSLSFRPQHVKTLA